VKSGVGYAVYVVDDHIDFGVLAPHPQPLRGLRYAPTTVAARPASAHKEGGEKEKTFIGK
jgi:hypothetical protein